MDMPPDITLRTRKLRAGNCEVLWDTSFNTYFYCVVWIAWNIYISEDTTKSIVTESLGQMNVLTRHDRLNVNLHPASVICPASWEATENREHSDGFCSPTTSTSTPTSPSLVLSWQTSPSEVVYVQSVRTTTKFCTIAATGHVTVGSSRRATPIDNLGTTNWQLWWVSVGWVAWEDITYNIG